MKCDELTPIDLDCNMGKDSVTGLVNHEPWKAYDIDEVDAGMRERRLRRALYKACANWAMSESLLLYAQAAKFESYLPTKGAKLRKRSSLWQHCYEQCKAMAEEYR